MFLKVSQDGKRAVKPRKKKFKEKDLFEKKLLKKSKGKLKLLNVGEISVPINIEISYASKKAIEVVEKLGGKVTITEK